MQKSFCYQSLLIVLFFLMTMTAFGQLEKGTLLPGGGVGVNFSDFDRSTSFSNYNGNTNSFSFAPNLGYSLGKGWLVGGGLSYNFTKLKQDRSNYKQKFKSHNIGVQAYVRKYLLTNTKFLPFAELRISNSWVNTKQESTYTDPTTAEEETSQYKGDYGVVRPTLSLGTDYFIRKNLALEVRASTSLNYYYKRGESEIAYDENLNFSASLVPFLHENSSYTGNALSKGSFTFNGDVSFITDFESSAIGLNLDVGYFAMDNLLLGLETNYQNLLGGTTFPINNNNYVFSPYVKYYVPVTEKMQLFGKVQYSGSTYRGDYMNSLELGGGINYFLNDNVAIESGLFYNWDESGINSFRMNTGLKYRSEERRVGRV